jgi:predicted Zn-dependent peptidase
MRTTKLDNGLFRTDADNGVSIASEHIAGVRSVAVGVWIRTASAHEVRQKMGVSHLLEHMVFKGTERRSARDIALELEVRGGSLDAFTARDHTSYQARILDEDLPRALDVLTDLVRNPKLRQSDLDLERRVVLEEISTVEDTPDDLVFDLHGAELWPDHPYGFPILGTRETVADLGADDLRELHRRAYHPGRIVIAAAGNVQHEALLQELGKCGWFSFEMGPVAETVPPLSPVKPGIKRVGRDLSQTHIVIGTTTFPQSDSRRYALMVLNTVLGGGMSSRLFQRVREELGLAYAVYAYHSFYQHTGVTGVYVGTHPSQAELAFDEIQNEMSRMAREGLSAEDLAAAKQQLKGQVTLSLESPAARMYRAATFVLYDQPYKTIDKILKDIDAISMESIADVASNFLDPERHIAVWLGPN